MPWIVIELYAYVIDIVGHVRWSPNRYLRNELPGSRVDPLEVTKDMQEELQRTLTRIGDMTTGDSKDYWWKLVWDAQSEWWVAMRK